MKIIDLLNKIANGEEVPKKIKLKGAEPIYQYENKEFYYYWKDKKTGKGGKATLDLIYNINDEVEIIEEDKKIEKLGIQLTPDYENKVNGYHVNDLERDLAFKINELIDEINKLKENK